MENNFEMATDYKPEQVGCPTMGYQDVTVCVPVTIKAFGEVGNAKTKLFYPDAMLVWTAQVMFVNLQ